MFNVFKKLKVCFKLTEELVKVEEPVTKKKVGFIKVEELIAESIADSMGKVAESVEKVQELIVTESMDKVESMGEQIVTEVVEIESNIQVSEIILTEVVDFMGESVEKVVNEN